MWFGSVILDAHTHTHTIHAHFFFSKSCAYLFPRSLSFFLSFLLFTPLTFWATIYSCLTLTLQERSSIPHDFNCREVGFTLLLLHNGMLATTHGLNGLMYKGWHYVSDHWHKRSNLPTAQNVFLIYPTNHRSWSALTSPLHTIMSLIPAHVKILFILSQQDL